MRLGDRDILDQRAGALQEEPVRGHHVLKGRAGQPQRPGQQLVVEHPLLAQLLDDRRADIPERQAGELAVEIVCALAQFAGRHALAEVYHLVYRLVAVGTDDHENP